MAQFTAICGPIMDGWRAVIDTGVAVTRALLRAQRDILLAACSRLRIRSFRTFRLLSIFLKSIICPVYHCSMVKILDISCKSVATLGLIQLF